MNRRIKVTSSAIALGAVVALKALGRAKTRISGDPRLRERLAMAMLLDTVGALQRVAERIVAEMAEDRDLRALPRGGDRDVGEHRSQRRVRRPGPGRRPACDVVRAWPRCWSEALDRDCCPFSLRAVAPPAPTGALDGAVAGRVHLACSCLRRRAASAPESARLPDSPVLA